MAHQSTAWWKGRDSWSQPLQCQPPVTPQSCRSRSSVIIVLKMNAPEIYVSITVFVARWVYDFLKACKKKKRAEARVTYCKVQKIQKPWNNFSEISITFYQGCYDCLYVDVFNTNIENIKKISTVNKIWSWIQSQAKKQPKQTAPPQKKSPTKKQEANRKNRKKHICLLLLTWWVYYIFTWSLSPNSELLINAE